MEKEFIPYQEALELKELGFAEDCLASYYHAGKKLDICEYVRHGEYTVLAPLYQQAFRWFREKYRLWENIGMQADNYYTLMIYRTLPDSCIIYNNKGYETYEEAELACLKGLIEIVKSKKDGTNIRNL